MTSIFKLIYPNFNTLYSPFHHFLITLNGNIKRSFSFPILFRNSNGVFGQFNFIDFESSYLARGYFFRDSQFEVTEKDTSKIFTVINMIFEYCLANFPEDPVRALDTYFFDNWPDTDYESFLVEDRSKYDIQVSWNFLNKNFETADSSFKDDVFDQRIEISLSWLNEDKVQEYFVGYWSLVSLQSLNAQHFPQDGFYYRRFMLLMHFFYKPTVDAALQGVIDELNRIGPASRQQLVRAFFSIDPIECMWSST